MARNNYAYDVERHTHVPLLAESSVTEWLAGTRPSNTKEEWRLWRADDEEAMSPADAVALGARTLPSGGCGSRPIIHASVADAITTWPPLGMTREFPTEMLDLGLVDDTWAEYFRTQAQLVGIDSPLGLLYTTGYGSEIQAGGRLSRNAVALTHVINESLRKLTSVRTPTDINIYTSFCPTDIGVPFVAPPILGCLDPTYLTNTNTLAVFSLPAGSGGLVSIFPLLGDQRTPPPPVVLLGSRKWVAVSVGTVLLDATHMFRVNRGVGTGPSTLTLAEESMDGVAGGGGGSWSAGFTKAADPAEPAVGKLRATRCTPSKIFKCVPA